MRTHRDRIRHSLFYEIVLLAITIPLGALFLDQSASKIGTISIFMSLIAMSWNFIYNLGFDKTLQALGHPLYPRGFFLRITHALLFEGGLVIATIPIMMWWLGLSLGQAIALDLGFLMLVPVYTLAYNWSYDLVFPVPTTV